MKELYQTRNFKSGFDKGLWFGLGHGKLLSYTHGKEPYTLKHTTPDSEKTGKASDFKADKYEPFKPDGKLTFDLLTNLARTGTDHEHD